MNRIPSSGQGNKKQDWNKKSLATRKGSQRFFFGDARQIAPCCHLVKGLTSGLAATLDQLPSVCSKAVREGQINLPSWAKSYLSSEVHFMLFHRSEYAKVPLESFGVVVLNKILNHGNQVCPVSESYSIVPFAFQDSPESFHWSVINTLSDPGHTLRHTGLGQHVVEWAACILESSVAVAQWMRIRFGSNRCPKSIEHQRIVIGVPDHIADNSPVI